MGWMLVTDGQWASPRPAASLLGWQTPCYCSLAQGWSIIQTIICTITLPQDCFLLLLSMGEAVCFFAVFPTLFPKENHAGRRGCMQAGVLKPQVPAPLQRLRGVL